MLCSSRYLVPWLTILLAVPPGCTDGGDAPSTLSATAAIDEDYLGHQGRLLLGFKAPDVRTFSLPQSVINPHVIAGGQVVATGLSGYDFVGMPMFAWGDGATIDMQIVDVVGPSTPGGQWQYRLEQKHPVTGAWEPACAEPLQLIPDEPQDSPPLAIAMSGSWLPDGLYSVSDGPVSFACKTGVVAKCDGWGYPVTADPPNVTENGLATNVTGPDMMQACTRMARADYCAEGLPNTIDGTPIHLDDIFIKPPPAPGFAFEAAWPGVAVVDRIVRRPPVICLSKLRWASLPLGGHCPLTLPDPRVDAKGTFCDDMTDTDFEVRGALTYSASTYLDAGLYTYTNSGTGTRLTTSHLLPQRVNLPPAWTIADPQIGFPISGGPAPRFEASIFAPVLPAEIPEADLVKLTSYKCPNDDLVTTTPAAPAPSCAVIADEGYLYPPNTPGRTPLRRWWSENIKRSYTTPAAPTTMIAGGWQLTEVLGGVIRAALDVNVRWGSLPSMSYALNVQTRGGEWISPCLDATQITSTSTVFRGVCVSAANRKVSQADIAAFQVAYTKAGITKYATQAYDGADTDAYIDLPGGKTTAVAITWNEVIPYARYTLSFRNSNGWVTCVDDKLLGNGTSHVHIESCASTGAIVKISTIVEMQVCATAPGGDKLTCSTVAYDGKQSRVAIELEPSE